MRNTNQGISKSVWIPLCLVGLSLILSSPQASAFFKNKEPKSKPLEAVNRNQYPLMIFERGTLQGDMSGGWRLDETQLVMTKNSRVSTDGEDGHGLVGGKEAVVMGYLSQGMLVVYQISMVSAGQSMEQGRFYDRKIDGLPQLAPPDVLR